MWLYEEDMQQLQPVARELFHPPFPPSVQIPEIKQSILMVNEDQVSDVQQLS